MDTVDIKEIIETFEAQANRYRRWYNEEKDRADKLEEENNRLRQANDNLDALNTALIAVNEIFRKAMVKDV